MLHNRRRRLESLAAREAAGEEFWSSHFDEAVRNKIVLVSQRITSASDWGTRFLSVARRLIMEDEGKLFLYVEGLSDDYDMINYISVASDDMMPSVVEALATAFSNPRLSKELGVPWAGAMFAEVVEQALREHRIQFELINGQMVEFSSRALHVDVVAPTLSLLGGDPKWASTEQAFQDALGELANGKPGDAITDAGTALQEALTTLGCSGNALGPLIKSARTKGLLASHDVPMLDSIERMMQWVSADRSEKGDAHTSAAPSVDDAWMAVHVVGAIILRLTKPDGRGA